VRLVSRGSPNLKRAGWVGRNTKGEDTMQTSSTVHHPGKRPDVQQTRLGAWATQALLKVLLLCLACVATIAAPAVAKPVKPAATPETALPLAVIDPSNPDSTRVYAVYEQGWRPLVEALSRQASVPLHLRWQTDGLKILHAINAHAFPLVMGPPNVIAQAIAVGYTPVVAVPGEQGVVLVNLNGHQPTKLADLTPQAAARLRLAIVRAPSVAEFGARALLQKNGLTFANFRSILSYPDDGSAVMALALDHADMAALGEKRFAALSKPAALPIPASLHLLAKLHTTAPSLGLAFLPGAVPEDAVSRLVSALASPDAALQSAMQTLGLQGSFVAASKKDYASMLDVAYTVPNVLPGARIVSVQTVKTLLQTKQATLIDARSPDEYVAGHIPGAVNVYYNEHSARAINFDAAQDIFDFTKVFPDRDRTYIFSCNGIECWKSYKAAVYALKHGYRHVLWLREGFPGWKAAGLPVAVGSQPGG